MKTLKSVINRILTSGLCCTALILGSANAMAVTPEDEYTEVYVSEWNAHMLDHKSVIPIYNGLIDLKNEDDETIYPEEFIIGLIANIEHEGKSGVVEYSFSRYHQYGFELPSGGIKMQTMDDIDYLLDWTTSNEGTQEGWAKKGSCGVSCVQWSFGRRITYLNKLKTNMGDRTEITDFDLSTTDLEMVLEELDPEGKYYKRIMSAVGNNPTASDYAEAFCDYYFMPKYADLNMSTTGESCIERRATAERLWKIYKSEKMMYKKITITY